MLTAVRILAVPALLLGTLGLFWLGRAWTPQPPLPADQASPSTDRLTAPPSTAAAADPALSRADTARQVIAPDPLAQTTSLTLIAEWEPQPSSRTAPRAPELHQRIRILRSSHRYPLWRCEEISGPQGLVSRAVMVADHLLVRRPAQLDEASWRDRLAAHDLLIRSQVAQGDWYRLSWQGGDPRRFSAVRHLIESEALATVEEPDYLVWPTTIPDDPSFGQLWSLHNTGQSAGVADADIDAPEAWDLGTGSRTIIVGVIDTGIDYRHPDLIPNLWINSGEEGLDGAGLSKRSNGIDDDGNGYIDDWRGWDFINNDNDPMDDHLHGTHCAGIIGASGNNATGVTGVCWEVSLVGLKFMGTEGGATSDAIAAIDYARRMGFHLTSNSWGGAGYSTALREAIEAAGAAGQPFVAAAGNEARDLDNDTPTYPANYASDCLISVAATDRRDQRSSFSNYGAASVDLAAPGTDILNCLPTTRTETMTDYGLTTHYDAISGTSMATPAVAGALALLQSLAPPLSVAEQKAALLATVDPLSSLTGRCVSGGRLNLGRLIATYGRPQVTLGALTLADDGSQGSSGDGDGTANPGETIALGLRLDNHHQQVLTCTISLQLDDPPAGCTLSGPTTWTGRSLPAQGSLTLSEAAVLLLASTVTAPSQIAAHLTVSSSDFGRTTRLPLTITIAPGNRAPQIVLPSPQLCGPSQIQLTATVTDDGLPAPSQLSYLWTSSSPDLTFVDAAAAQAQIICAVSGEHPISLRVSDGRRSSERSGIVRYDGTPPPAPLVSGPAVSYDARPQWRWQGHAAGAGVFRLQLDADLFSAATPTTAATTWLPASALSSGGHTLYVQERDAVGNWSASGSQEILIDIQAPAAPSDSDPRTNQIAKDAATGSPVGLTVVSIDPDSDLLTYHLLDDAAGRFQIDATSGIVCTARRLDDDPASSATISVSAADAARSGAVHQFTISLLPRATPEPPGALSDHDPTPDQIPEQAAIGTAVGIQVVSAGATPALYRLANDADGQFTIDATAGTISTAARLDYETAPQHSVRVEALTAAGKVASSADFTIQVLDDGAVAWTIQVLPPPDTRDAPLILRRDDGAELPVGPAPMVFSERNTAQTFHFDDRPSPTANH